MQAGDVAFSVPDSLVVTLERVLGNETIGKVLLLLMSYALSNLFIMMSSLSSLVALLLLHTAN